MNEYTRFVEKYVTGRRKRFQTYKIYIFLIRQCPSVRMNVEIPGTIRARRLGISIQILETDLRCKFRDSFGGFRALEWTWQGHQNLVISQA